MSLTLPPKSQEFATTPAGNHLATCYRVIDLGTQKGEWKGKPTIKHKIMVSWELPDEMMEDGRPFSMHQRYTLSSSDRATLRQHLESWRGKGFTDEEFGTFDLGKLLGHSCLLNIVHEAKGDRTYANIASVGALPKGMTTRPLVNAPVYFSLGDFKQEIYDGLSDSLKALIALSPEYQELKGGSKLQQDVPDGHESSPLESYDDSIPF
jgi:hypothetical protein